MSTKRTSSKKQARQQTQQQQESKPCSSGCGVITFLFILALLPLFFLHRDTSQKVDLAEIAAAIDNLEREHKSLEHLITTLETEANELPLPPPPPPPPKLSNVPGYFSDTAPKPPPPYDTSSIKTAEPVVITPPLSDAPAPISYNTPSSSQSHSVLVVGGTDGSGTRSVVKILTKLGVTMVSEDPETFDIHADSVGGWPTIVNPIIAQTKSLHYDPSSLPLPLQMKMKDSLGKLLEIAEGDSHKPTSHVLAKGGALPKPKGASASRIKYGFKAPVAMTLGPYWAHLLPHFRLLHVLRDGRDIAFSANQGPVQKFFTAMYGFRPERDELKAMRLWSDWNIQLKTWAEEHVNALLSSKDTSKSFGYFVIHSEDLVDENREVRYAAIAHLAAWVGSDVSDKDLCCLAMSGSQFMGSHDRSDKNTVGEKQLTKRYGKWRQMLKNDANLRDSLQSMGVRGLKGFGYEPLRPLAKSGDHVQGKARCDWTAMKECGVVVPGRGDALTDGSPRYYAVTYLLTPSVPTLSSNLASSSASSSTSGVGVMPIEPLTSWGASGLCTVRAQVDYKGGDLSSISIASTTAVEGEEGKVGGVIPVWDKDLCCQRCRQTPTCKHFTIDPEGGICYLKHSKGTKVALEAWDKVLLSGDVV